MISRSVLALWVVLLLAMSSTRVFSQEASLPQVDRRAIEIRNLDTPCAL